MNKFNKNLIMVITILLLIFIIQNYLNKLEKKVFYNFRNNNKKEHFQGVDVTNITSFEPRQGDSSTIITITGTGLDFISEIKFNDVECVIFEDRTDETMKILPPSLGEIGKTIQEVRDIMNNGTDIGLPTEKVSIIRRNKDGSVPNITPQDRIRPSDSIELKGIIFYYIDKINYLDNCPKIKEPTKPEPVIEDEVDTNTEIPGTDMHFLKEVLPKKMERLQSLIDKQNEKIQYYESLNIDNNNIEYLSQIQALEALNNMKKEQNIGRYNIHKTISDRYGYTF